MTDEVERLRKALREIEAHVNAVLQTPGMAFSTGLIQTTIRRALDEEKR